MTKSVAINGQAPDDPAFVAMSARAVGTNINPQTLLATDYLNHFNEIIMLLEMIPDMTDCFEDVQAWKPKSYQDHFRDSQFRDKDLAVEAYDHVPSRYREPFETVIDQMNRLVFSAVERIGPLIEDAAEGELRHVCSDVSIRLQRMSDVASAIIHGSEKIIQRAEIDGILGH
jgi:hypothetical protein